MKALKHPFIAFLLAAVLVLGGTALSVRQFLGKESDAINDLLYSGILVDGTQQPAIASCLQKISIAAGDLARIAAEQGLDTEELDTTREDLDLAFRYSGDDAPYLHFCYQQLMEQISETTSQLNKKQVSGDDEAELQNCLAVITAQQEAIESSAYNERVRSFLRENDRFPTEFLADFSGVKLPDYFA